ncbi:MAG: ribosome biogenesis protein [Nitrososphaeria archaeon]|nr:ribosome biogenesis protein [Nitrosopumilaceae archaeon]NIP10440.1 ribosome biogenesis protein [Nitrosopumilaceae archaeon]NIP90822.1 ribosome biogenesis protein [Nitrososphaeria archaeon]NIS95083.1 ribosome biogenesis protein [Nitrosopumilaceae archaeon]
MISLVLAESALELVPKKLRNHPSVISHARKLGKRNSEILLDNSWHFAAMKGIDDEKKRGRPDLVHLSMLEATSIPLYKENQIKIFIHTIDDKVIYLGDNVHIPKSYHRFEGLIEKLFSDKIIKSENQTLLEIKENSFSDLIDEINPSTVIGFSTQGEEHTFESAALQLPDNCCIVIGGFQKGHFSDEVQNRLNQLIAIRDTSFEAHVVVARILYEYEKTIFM